MAKLESLTIRLESEQMNQIRALSGQFGISKAKLVREILSRFLELSDQQRVMARPAPPARKVDPRRKRPGWTSFKIRGRAPRSPETAVEDHLSVYAYSTQATAGQLIRQFEDHAGKPWYKAGDGEVHAFFEMMNERGYTINSQRNNRSILGKLFAYGVAHGLVDRNPVELVGVPE